MPGVRTIMLGCTALVAGTLTAHADELADLKAEIAALDARVAAIEATPALPDGYQLITISQGELADTPGAPLSARERAAYGNRSTIISVMPTADAPGGTTISWSGYTRAAVVYNGIWQDLKTRGYDLVNGEWVRNTAKDYKTSNTTNDWDVEARAQLLVQASTDTAVGNVGVELKLRANAEGNGNGVFYGEKVWGYWSMTDNLTLGGGYNDSLGKIIYGYDGSCTCYYTDNADVALDPGDTTQLRMTYTQGPFSAAVAVEDASFASDTIDSGLLGVAGELAYKSDVFSGQIAGVWRDSNNAQTDASSIWQVGVGGQLNAGDIGYVSFGAAAGQGPYTVVSSQGIITNEADYDNTWWGATALASLNLTSATHAEFAGGYKHRDGNQATYSGFTVDSVNYDTYAVLAGLYYMPVDQLTVGLEGEWYREDTSVKTVTSDSMYKSQDTSDNVWADVVAVWSF